MDLESIRLGVGNHETRESGVCAMEAVAWLAGEEHSDHPACTCPVIAAYVRRLNDRLGDNDRQKLKAYLPRLLGTTASVAIRRQRAFVAADYAVRVFAPIALDARGYKDHAAKLRACAKIVDRKTAEAGRKAAASADAAYAYADAAAAAAAYAAAYAATAAAAYAYASAAAAASTAARSQLVTESIACLDAMLACTAKRVVKPRKRARK